jgi:bifunctional DNA-binding transcriptional regulator/antitoxin component of YhaV-PrlF toxin-antitoxin module
MTELVELLIDETGCIRIPVDIQDRLGLEPGTFLVLEEADDGGIRLRARENLPILVDKDGILVVRAEPLAGFADMVRQDRDSRVASLVEQSRL